MLNSTIMRANQHSAGAQKRVDQAIGRSLGRLTTKIHVMVDKLGSPVALSPRPNLAQAKPLLAQVDPEVFLADTAYDANALTYHFSALTRVSGRRRESAPLWSEQKRLNALSSRVAVRRRLVRTGAKNGRTF